MDKTGIADVLDTAARLYEDETIDWCQGNWYQGGMPLAGGLIAPLSMCAEGAILKAVGFSVEEIETLENTHGTEHMVKAGFAGRYNEFKRVRWAVGRHLGDATCVPNWNDEPVRKKQDVIDLFKETAKDLRNSEQG